MPLKEFLNKLVQTGVRPAFENAQAYDGILV
jgi:hypothetical protein